MLLFEHSILRILGPVWDSADGTQHIRHNEEFREVIRWLPITGFIWPQLLLWEIGQTTLLGRTMKWWWRSSKEGQMGVGRMADRNFGGWYTYLRTSDTLDWGTQRSGWTSQRTENRGDSWWRRHSIALVYSHCSGVYFDTSNFTMWALTNTPNPYTFSWYAVWDRTKQKNHVTLLNWTWWT